MTTAAIPTVLLSAGSEIGLQHQDKVTSVLSLGRYQILRRRSRNLLSDGDVFLAPHSYGHSHGNSSKFEGEATLATPETDDVTLPLPGHNRSTNIQGQLYQSDSPSLQLDNFNGTQKTSTSLLLETHLSNQEPKERQMFLPVTSSVSREHLDVINKEPSPSWRLQFREEDNSERFKVSAKHSDRDDCLPTTSQRLASSQAAKTRSVSMHEPQPSFHSQDIKKKKDRKISDVTWKPSLEKAKNGENQEVSIHTSGKKHKSKFLFELYNGAEKIKNFISRGKRKESKSTEEKTMGTAPERKKSSSTSNSKTKDSPDSVAIASSCSDTVIPSYSNRVTRDSVIISDHFKRKSARSNLCTFAQDEALPEESPTKLANSVFVTQVPPDNSETNFGIKTYSCTSNQRLFEENGAALKVDLPGAKAKRAGTDLISSAATEEDVFLIHADSQNVGYIDDVFTPETSTCSTNSRTDWQGQLLSSSRSDLTKTQFVPDSGRHPQTQPASILEAGTIQQVRQDPPCRHRTPSTLLHGQQTPARPATMGHLLSEGTETTNMKALPPQVPACKNVSETLDNLTSRQSQTQVDQPGLGQMRWRAGIHREPPVDADKKTDNLHMAQNPAVCALTTFDDDDEEEVKRRGSRAGQEESSLTNLRMMLLQSTHPVQRHQVRGQMRTSRPRPQSERVQRTSQTVLESPTIFQPKQTLTASSLGSQAEKEPAERPSPSPQALQEHDPLGATKQLRKYQNHTSSVPDPATNMQLHEVKKYASKNAVEGQSNIIFVSKVLEEAKAKIRLRSQSLTSESRIPRSFRSSLETHPNHDPTCPNYQNNTPADKKATMEHKFVTNEISSKEKTAPQSVIFSQANLDSPSSRYREARRQILKSANVFPTPEDANHHTAEFDSLKCTQFKEQFISSQVSLGNLQRSGICSLDTKENKTADVFTQHQEINVTINSYKDDIKIDDSNKNKLNYRHNQQSKKTSELTIIPGTSNENVSPLEGAKALVISAHKLERIEDMAKTNLLSTNNVNLSVQRSNIHLTDFEKLEKGLKPSNSKTIVSTLTAKFTDKAKENISQISTNLRRTQSLHLKPDKKKTVESDQTYFNFQGWPGAQTNQSKQIEAHIPGDFNVSNDITDNVNPTKEEWTVLLSKSPLKVQQLKDQGTTSRENVDLKPTPRLDRKKQISRSLTEQDRGRSGLYTSQLLVSISPCPEKTSEPRAALVVKQLTDVQPVFACSQTPKPSSVPNIDQTIESQNLASADQTSESKGDSKMDTLKASTSDLTVNQSSQPLQISQNLLNLLPCSAPSNRILEPHLKASPFLKPSDAGADYQELDIQSQKGLNFSGSKQVETDPTLESDERSLKVTSLTQGNSSTLAPKMSEFLESRAPVSNSPEQPPGYHGDDTDQIPFSQKSTVESRNSQQGIQSHDDSKIAPRSTVPTWRQIDSSIDQPVTAMEKAFSLLLEELDKIGSSEGNPSDLELSDNEDVLFSSRCSRDLAKITEKQRSNSHLTLWDADLVDGKGNIELSANELLLESGNELIAPQKHQVELGQLEGTVMCPREAEVPEVSYSGDRNLVKNRGAHIVTDSARHAVVHNLEVHAMTDNKETHTTTDLSLDRGGEVEAKTEMPQDYFSHDQNDQTRHAPLSSHAPFPSTIDTISQSNQPEVDNTTAITLSSHDYSTKKPAPDNTTDNAIPEYRIDNQVLDNATDNLVPNNKNNNPVPDLNPNSPEPPAKDTPAMEVDTSDGHLMTHKSLLGQPPFNLNERARNSSNFLTTCSFNVSEDLDGAITVQAVTGDQHQNKVVTVRTKTQRTPSDASERLRDTIVEKKTFSPSGSLVLERDVTHSKTRLTSRGSNYYTRSRLSSKTRWPQEGGQSVEHNVCVQNENRSASKGKAWGDTATAHVLLEDGGESRMWSSHGSLDESPDKLVEIKMGSHDRDGAELKDQGQVGESESTLENREKSAAAPPLDVPKFQKLLSDQTVTEGKPVSLVCQVSQATSVRWQKDGVVQRNSSDFRQTFDGRLARLEIEELVLADGGQYACVASNVCGEATTSCWLTVTANEHVYLLAPIFLGKFQNQTLDEGETLTLECDVIGCPRPSLLWFKDGQELKQSSKFRYVYDDRVATLHVSLLTPGDSGNYTCVAQNEVGSVSAEASINVQEKRSAPKFSSSISDVSVSVGGNIVLQCHVTGRPLPVVSWLKDGRQILPTSRILQSFRGGLARLDVLSADLQDTGCYECVAGNSVLAVSCRCQVDVIRPIAACQTPAPNNKQIQSSGPRVTRRVFKKLSEPRPADIIAAVIQRASAHTLQRAHSFSAPNSTVNSPWKIVPVSADAAPFKNTMATSKDILSFSREIGTPSRDVSSIYRDSLVPSREIPLTSSDAVSTSGDIPSTYKDTAAPSRDILSTSRDTMPPSNNILSISRDTVTRSRDILLPSRNIVASIIENVTASNRDTVTEVRENMSYTKDTVVSPRQTVASVNEAGYYPLNDLSESEATTFVSDNFQEDQSSPQSDRAGSFSSIPTQLTNLPLSSAPCQATSNTGDPPPTPKPSQSFISRTPSLKLVRTDSDSVGPKPWESNLSRSVSMKILRSSDIPSKPDAVKSLSSGNSSYQTSSDAQINEFVAAKSAARKTISNNLERSVSMKNIIRNLNSPARSESVSSLAQNSSSTISDSRLQEMASEASANQPFTSGLERSVSMNIFRSETEPSKIETSWASTTDVASQFPPPSNVQEPLFNPSYTSRQSLSSNLGRSASMKILRSQNLSLQAGSVDSLHDARSALSFSTSQSFDTQDNATKPVDYKRDPPISGYRSMSLKLNTSPELENSSSIKQRPTVNRTSENNHASDTTLTALANLDQMDTRSSASFQSSTFATLSTLPATSYESCQTIQPQTASSNLSSSSQGSTTFTSSSNSQHRTGNLLNGQSSVQPEARPVPAPRQLKPTTGFQPGISSPEYQSRANAIKRVQSLPLHSVRPLVVQRTSGPAGHRLTSMPSYDTITDEEELHKLMSATEDFDERKKIRARLREIRDKQREENEARRKQREAEAEDLVKQKFQRAEEEKKKKMEAYKQQAPTHERDSKYHQVSQSLIQDKYKAAEEEKAKKLAAYASIASKATGENTVTKIEDTPGGGSRYVVQKTTESKGFGGTSYGKPAEVTAQELTEKLMRSSGPGVRGHVTVRTEKWNSTDGLVEKSEKSHSWGAKPQGAKSAMAAFKQMDNTNNPSAGLAKPKGMVRSPSAIKDILLNWAKAMTQGYSGVEITNFSSSWNDGMAFCALIHHFFPQAFDFSKLDPKQRRYNFTLAFDTAEKEADIAPLLDVEDMVKMKNPDWKCVFTYVQSIYRHLKDHENNKAGPVEQ